MAVNLNQPSAVTGAGYSPDALRALLESDRVRAGLIQAGAEIGARGALGAAETSNQRAAVENATAARYAVSEDEIAQQDRALGEEARQFNAAEANDLYAQERAIGGQLQAQQQDAVLSDWLSQQRMTFAEQQQLQRDKNSIAAIMDDKSYPEELRRDMALSVKSRVDVGEARMRFTQQQLMQERYEQEKQERTLQAGLYGADGQFNAQNMQKYVGVVDDPNGSGQKMPVLFNPYDKRPYPLPFKPTGGDGGAEGGAAEVVSPPVIKSAIQNARREIATIDAKRVEVGDDPLAPEERSAMLNRLVDEEIAVYNRLSGRQPSQQPADPQMPRPFQWDNPEDRKRLTPQQTDVVAKEDAAFRAIEAGPLPEATKREMLGLMRSRQEILARGGGFPRAEDVAELRRIENRLNAMPDPEAGRPSAPEAPTPRSEESERAFRRESRRSL
jgi:hypothetical protein